MSTDLLMKEEKVVSIKESERYDLSTFYRFDEVVNGVYFSANFKAVILAATATSSFSSIDHVASSIRVMANEKTIMARDVFLLSNDDLVSRHGRICAKERLSVVASLVSEQLNGEPGVLRVTGDRNHIGIFRLGDREEYLAFVYWNINLKSWCFDSFSVEEYKADPSLWLFFLF